MQDTSSNVIEFPKAKKFTYKKESRGFLRTEDEWSKKTLCDVPCTSQRMLSSQNRLAPTKSAPTLHITIPSSGRPSTPHSAWQKRTLAALSQLPKTNVQPQVFKRPAGLDLMADKGDASGGKDGLDDDNESLAGGSAQDQMSPASQGSRASFASRRSSVLEMLKDRLPDAGLVLQRLRGGQVGFSDVETERMMATFQRFRVPDSQDVHKDDLKPILDHLGYYNVQDEKVMELANDISDYATLESSDFVIFMERYAKMESDSFQATFEKFDEDKSGYLDKEEIMKFLAAQGYTPLRSAVSEAIKIVDVDRNGTLDIDELVLLLHLYRHSEGFTKAEVDKFGKCFTEEQLRSRSTGGARRTVPCDRLSLLLTKFFGPAHWEAAMTLSKDIASRQQGVNEGENNTGPPVGLRFNEALVWARRLRDKEFESYREAFNQFDADKSGTIDLMELREVLHSLGFTLPHKTVADMINAAKTGGEWNETLPADELDYDAFVHFMMILSQTDGFSPSEVEEIEATFHRFDDDGSGDIDVVELSDMLHYMGYQMKIDEVQLLLSKVDYNANGTLDMREFIRFMRLRREAELSIVKEVFQDHCNDDEKLSKDAVRIALKDLCRNNQELDGDMSPGSPKKKENLDELLQALDISDIVDFDGFVLLADDVRAVRVKELRKRAGFSDAEIDRFQAMFDAHDVNGDKTLDKDEVTRLLINLGFQLRTVEDQKNMMDELKTARQKAAERGLTGACVQEHGPVDFWVIVQLLRGLYRRDDKLTVSKVARAAEQSKFSNQEVNDFQEVFMHWHDKDSRYTEESGVADNQEENSDGSKSLSSSSVIRLLRNLGVKLETRHTKELDAKVEELCETGMVDFADFLRLMRWMLDANFANINSVSPS